MALGWTKATATMVLLLLCCSARVRAQATDGSAAAMAAITAAEKDLAADRGDAALVRLLAAESALRRARPGNARDAAATALDALLAKADPLRADRAAKNTAAAKLLIAIAKAYRGKKWNQAAESVLAIAATLDPALAQKEGGAAPKASGSDRITALGRGTLGGEWTIKDGALWTPAKLPETSAWYLTTTRHEDQRFALSLDVGNREAMFGMIVGGVDDNEYFIVDHEFFDDGQIGVRLYGWRGGDLAQLGGVTVAGKKNRTEPVRLAVDVRGNRVETFVDGKPALTAEASAPIRGTIGFYVSAISPFRGSLAIRDIDLGPLPDAPSDGAGDAAEADLQQRVTAATERADKLLAQKQPEAAVEQWRAARALARELRSATLRVPLLAAIDKSIAQNDSLQPRRNKAFADAADQLQAIATAYADKSMPMTAGEIAAGMARLDPDGHGERAAAFTTAATAASSAASAAQQKAAQGAVVDDGALAATFKGGTRPLGDEWRFGFDGALTPSLPPAGSCMLLAVTGEHTGNATASVRCHLPDGASAGIVLGYRAEGGAVRGLLRRRGDRFELLAQSQQGIDASTWSTIGRVAITIAPTDKDGWLQLEVAISDTGMLVRSGEQQLPVTLENLSVKGRIGLCAANGGTEPVAVGFGNFRSTNGAESTAK